jgi:hypothetical protein
MYLLTNKQNYINASCEENIFGEKGISLENVTIPHLFDEENLHCWQMINNELILDEELYQNFVLQKNNKSALENLYSYQVENDMAICDMFEFLLESFQD